MKVHIAYLDEYTKDLENLMHMLLHQQDIADEVTADIDQVERLSKVLEELKLVVDTLPLD